MAVAVKNTPEVGSASLLDRMAVASLAGTAYALGTLGIVFYLLPSLWATSGWEGIVSVLVRGLVQLVVLGALIVFGVRLLGPKAAHGVRAGIFVGLVGFFLILLLTRWASLWIEHGSFVYGVYNPTVGAILTAVVGLALLAVGIRLFLRPASEKMLLRLEDQGWFTGRAYKSLQGLRVRRGTTFGILLIVGAGIWTLLAHNTLRRGAPDWRLDLPFTGRVVVEYAGDVRPELEKRYPDKDFGPASVTDPTAFVVDPGAFVKVEQNNAASDLVPGQVVPRDVFEQAAQKTKAAGKEPPTAVDANLLVVDRYALKEINQTIDPATHVKILQPGGSDFHTNQIVDRAEYHEAVKKLKASDDPEPKVGPPEPASEALTYRSLTLLPSVQFTIPLMMLAAALWLAWRVVNVPAFADFLIATEAEMNKVSWTTQRRLVQDTIVVLVTVVLMTFFLFSMDMVWKYVLSWKPVGVLILPDETPETSTNVENRPW